MFIDYYQLLGISESATIEEIRTAYRQQSVIWHPDKNLGKDTTSMMQYINEAYTVLSDPKSRTVFDNEYQKFKEYASSSTKFSSAQQGEPADNTDASSSSDKSRGHTWSYDYRVQDEELRDIIEKARQKANELVAEFMVEFRKDAKEVRSHVWEHIKSYLVVVAILFILGLLGRLFIL